MVSSMDMLSRSLDVLADREIVHQVLGVLLAGENYFWLNPHLREYVCLVESSQTRQTGFGCRRGVLTESWQEERRMDQMGSSWVISSAIVTINWKCNYRRKIYKKCLMCKNSQRLLTLLHCNGHSWLWSPCPPAGWLLEVHNRIKINTVYRMNYTGYSIV